MKLFEQQQNKFLELIRTLVIILPIAFFIRTFLYGLYQVPTGSMEKTMLVGERFLADKLTVWFHGPSRGDIITFNDAWQFQYSKNPAVRLFQQYVWGPSNWTKRVIGIPGDHLKGVIEDGKPVIYLNGKKLDEPYLNPFPLIGVYAEGASPLDQDAFHMRTYDPNYSYEDQPYYHMNAYNVQVAKKAFERVGRPWKLDPQTPVQLHAGQKSPDEFEVQLGDNEYWAMGDNRLGSGDSRFFGPLDGSHIHGKIVFRLWSIDSYESWWLLDLLKHPIDFWRRVRWSRFFQTLN